MIIEIDKKSGFCFGVINAIRKAEEVLKTGKKLYSLGYIVHNEAEVNRLQLLGLTIINHDGFFKLKDCTVLIRAHGEPPSTYDYAQKNGIELIEATCPVVLKLQQRVKKAGIKMAEENGQVVIYGHFGHAEVTGLTGQTDDKAIVIETIEDIKKIDPDRPVEIFSQTTKPVKGFKEITEAIQQHVNHKGVEFHDTICRQVSDRVPHLEQFARQFDVIVFVGGEHSSNAKVLFDVCKTNNSQTHFVSAPAQLEEGWFNQAEKVGVCGATSTPQWLMQQVADRIGDFYNKS
jgi:4-hydroxy-3-methylbut-2-enyl diphosphate reductase